MGNFPVVMRPLTDQEEALRDRASDVTFQSATVGKIPLSCRNFVTLRTENFVKFQQCTTLTDEPGDLKECEALVAQWLVYAQQCVNTASSVPGKSED